MFPFRRRRKAALAAEIEALVGTDLDEAASRFAASRRHLHRDEATRLADRITRRIEAREHETYLARALADGSISPTAAFELLETYEAAGYISTDHAARHRRHVFKAHRRELNELLAQQGADRFDYFRMLDGYRSSGYLSHDELEELEYIIDVKLNPDFAASRLFTESQVAPDPTLQEDLLHRYLMEFPGFPDYSHAASIYLSLRIDSHWRKLPQLASAREATLKTQELHALLKTFLPHTSDLGEYVPIEEILADLHAHARDFDPEPGADDVITNEDVGRRVVVTHKKEAPSGSYQADRNEFIRLGATGRVIAAYEDLVLVEHSGHGFTYTQSWGLAYFPKVHLAALPKKTDLAVWAQAEVGPLTQRRPSPVFVHQYQAAVARLGTVLDKHRQDNS